MEYLGAWGTLIHEKNLKSKISCQTPFQDVVNDFSSTLAIYFMGDYPQATCSVRLQLGLIQFIYW
jgi:hypothetical protein